MNTFQKGDLVKVSLHGIKAGIGSSPKNKLRRYTTGVVAAPQEGDYLRVRPDGHKTAGYYAAVFWESADVDV